MTFEIYYQCNAEAVNGNTGMDKSLSHSLQWRLPERKGGGHNILLYSIASGGLSLPTTTIIAARRLIMFFREKYHMGVAYHPSFLYYLRVQSIAGQIISVQYRRNRVGPMSTFLVQSRLRRASHCMPL